MAGTLTGIGTGPGEPELMTLKAVEKIRASDIVVLPNKDKQKCIAYAVAKKLLDELEAAGQGKKCVFLDFPMIQDSAAIKQAQQNAAAEICRYLDEGLNVAFLTIGDPAVYSLTASRSIDQRENVPKTLEQIVAETYADPNPFPPFNFEFAVIVFSPVLVLILLGWLIHRRHKKQKARRMRAPKPVNRYVK